MRDETVLIDGLIFKRTFKPTAIKAILAGNKFFIVPARVNSFHFHSGWCLATNVIDMAYLRERDAFEGSDRRLLECFIQSFTHYNCCSELGIYPAFYVNA